jgi:hypothetical protein
MQGKRVRMGPGRPISQGWEMTPCRRSVSVSGLGGTSPRAGRWPHAGEARPHGAWEAHLPGLGDGPMQAQGVFVNLRRARNEDGNVREASLASRLPGLALRSWTRMRLRVRVCMPMPLPVCLPVLPFVVVVVVGDDLDASVGHSSGRQQSIGDSLQLVAPAAQDDDLEAPPVVEVNMQGRAHLIPQLVLELGQPLGEFPDMVIVDESQRRHRRSPLRDLRSRDLRPGEVAEDLRSGHATLFDDLVEVPEQRPLHRDAEPDEVVLHRAQVSAGAIRRAPPGTDSTDATGSRSARCRRRAFPPERPAGSACRRRRGFPGSRSAPSRPSSSAGRPRSIP